MFDIVHVDERLKQKLTWWEFGGAIFIFCLWAGLLLTNSAYFYDFRLYLGASHGNFYGYYYGYWLLPFFYLLSLLPFNLSVLLWIALGLSGVIFASRVFNSNSILALLSYQLSFSMFYGQITAFICGILGLFWWSMHKRQWLLAGLALFIASAKPQSGGVFAFYLWLFAEIPWKEKLKILIVPTLGVLLTFAIYPSWLADIIARLKDSATAGNITLWHQIGPLAVLVLLPAIFIPMKKENKFFCLVAATILSLPYFLQAELLTFFIFPVGLIPVILGFLVCLALQLAGDAGQIIGMTVLLWFYGKGILTDRIGTVFTRRPTPGSV